MSNNMTPAPPPNDNDHGMAMVKYRGGTPTSSDDDDNNEKTTAKATKQSSAAAHQLSEMEDALNNLKWEIATGRAMLQAIKRDLIQNEGLSHDDFRPLEATWDDLDAQRAWIERQLQHHVAQHQAREERERERERERAE